MKIVRLNGSYHVIDSTGTLIERCHNYATAKMYLNRARVSTTSRLGLAVNQLNKRAF